MYHAFRLLAWQLTTRTIWATSWENQQSAYAKTKAQISFAVTAKMISAFVFATRIVQFLYFLNPKVPFSSHLLCLYSPVSVGPVRKPQCWFSHEAAQYYSELHDFISMFPPEVMSATSLAATALPWCPRGRHHRLSLSERAVAHSVGVLPGSPADWALVGTEYRAADFALAV